MITVLPLLGAALAMFLTAQPVGGWRSAQYLPCTGQCVIEMRDQISASDDIDESSLTQHIERLAMQATQDHGAAMFLETLDHAFQGIECGGIHSRNQV